MAGLIKPEEASHLFYRKGREFGFYDKGKWHSIGSEMPKCSIKEAIPLSSVSILNPGDYDFTHPMTTNAPQKQYSGVINFNDEGLKNIKKIDVREVELDE